MTEHDWTKHLASTEFEGYQTKARLWDRTRPDLIGESEVIEVDWSWKWQEGVGQASFYGGITGLRPSLLLLFKEGINSEKERLRGYRAKLACISADVDLYFYDCRDKTLTLA